MNIKAETTVDRKGNRTGVAVTVGKKKHKSDIMEPSVLVGVDGTQVTMLGFDETGGASQHIDQLVRSIRKNPGRHLGSPEHLFAFELRNGEFIMGAAIEPAMDARREYDKQDQISRAFRANLNKNK